MKYILNKDRFDNKSGAVVYRNYGYDYGCSNDDTRYTGIEHISVTLKEDGTYPFFTVPICFLDEVTPA